MGSHLLTRRASRRRVQKPSSRRSASSRDRREADECTFTPNAKRRESVTPVARAKPPQSERPPPPPPPPPKRDEVVLSARPPPPKRDVDVDLGFVRVRLAASDGDDLPALVDAAAAAHGLDGAQQDRLLVALAAAVLGWA